MTIRWMAAADIDTIQSLEGRATSHPWSTKLLMDSFDAGDSCMVLEVDNIIAGFCVLSIVIDEASLLNIAIDPAQQGKGYGKQLLQYGLQLMIDEGAVACFLEVRESNYSAIGLYQSMGFEVVGYRKNYYPADNGREGAQLMCLQLNNLGSMQ